MKIFLDSANIEDIKKAYDMGAISGVTTNPSIISRENRKFDDILADVTKIMVDGPVFAEVLSLDAEGMIKEGRALAKKSKNIVVKIPMIPEGLKAVKTLAGEGITVCVTVIFSAPQAILAANAGASYVAPFVGRLDDIGENGLDLAAEIREIFDAQG
ncbi:MAG: fructose-6-phosphate aldolase, partial [Clostridia bacterium]|nr:fructose-6-phosphate aldolase [Clostridia bacterium]